MQNLPKIHWNSTFSAVMKESYKNMGSLYSAPIKCHQGRNRETVLSDMSISKNARIQKSEFASEIPWCLNVSN